MSKVKAIAYKPQNLRWEVTWKEHREGRPSGPQYTGHGADLKFWFPSAWIINIENPVLLVAKDKRQARGMYHAFLLDQISAWEPAPGAEVKFRVVKFRWLGCVLAPWELGMREPGYLHHPENLIQIAGKPFLKAFSE